jgi:hypothetical protein
VFKSVQHADDFTNMVQDVHSLQKILEVIKDFIIIAGTKININKTESLVSWSLSSKYANENTIHGIYIAKENVKSLGVY